MAFALCSRRVVTRSGVHEAAVVVGDDGRIAAVLPHADLPAGTPLTDLGNDVLMPGLVDTHVHINDPGRADWEGWETGTRAAAAGGVTTLLDMPLNSAPVTTTGDALAVKAASARGRCRVDVGFHGGLVPGSAGHIEALLEGGVFSIKAFLVHSRLDDFANAAEADLRAVMPLLARRGVPLQVHAELEGPDAAPLSDPHRYAQYLASRPRTWEQHAIEMMIGLCREYGCPTHIVHLSSADAVPALRAARAEGLPLTVETGPHYLFFDAEEIRDGDTRFKCAPPIRERENRERLWEALAEGVIDMIASDHSPCPPEMKATETGDFAWAWGGISSLQLTLPAVWTEAQRRGFGPGNLARWLCRRPAQIFGLGGRKGVVEAGMDADLVAWDPEASFILAPEMLHHRHKLTPYEGRALRGAVRQTWLRGTKVYDAGGFFEPPTGELLWRSHT